MFLLHKPSEKEINDFLAAQSDLPFSYQDVGATKGHNAPDGYPINHYRKELGNGEQTYKKAIKAIESWKMYDLDWTQLCPSNAPIKIGEVVATLINHLGFWSLNPCRIIYLIDEENDKFNRYGFGFVPLDDKLFFTLFRMCRKSSKPKPVAIKFVVYFINQINDTARIQRPKTEVIYQSCDNFAYLDGCV